MPNSKLRQATAESESECALDMSPMIDMVFLLLIFFIVNATAIVVKTDPKVKPPVADRAKPVEVKKGRIVVNVHEDGTFTAEDFNVILPNELAITDMVKKAKEKNDGLALESRLHLRGDKDAIFKHGFKVIRAAAAGGVTQVIFATFTR
ncbi:MAG TPA: biopolymer transporter ExbD [Luteolibacter sp.]|nr:biopolymer transporter ExbD [Luteolibacter sp.]